MEAPSARRLTNAELTYRHIYVELCSLYTTGQDTKAEALAWEMYQDPHIPLVLRIMCCNVLAESEEGDYHQFAMEAVEHATSNLALDPENETAQLLFKEAKEVLTNAENDLEHDKIRIADLTTQYENQAAADDIETAAIQAKSLLGRQSSSQPSETTDPGLEWGSESTPKKPKSAYQTSDWGSETATPQKGAVAPSSETTPSKQKPGPAQTSPKIADEQDDGQDSKSGS